MIFLAELSNSGALGGEGHLPRDLWLICTVFAAFFGACVGSFLNVCVYRIPRDLSVVVPRSYCTSCDKTIPWYLNIPVLSYFMLRGRCRFCGAGFSSRYALIELLTAMFFVLGFLAFPPIGANPPLAMQALPSLRSVPVYWLFVSGLILGTFVDFEHYILPDSVTIGGMVAGLILSPLIPELHGMASAAGGFKSALLGMAVGFGLLQAVAIIGRLAFRKEAMGFGDVKLMGAMGAFLGWRAVLFILIAGSLFGSLVGITLIACGKRNLGGRLPFGPYLALGGVTWLFWGARLMDAYLSLFQFEPLSPL